MDSVLIPMSSTTGIFTTIFLSSVFGYFYFWRSRKEVKLPLVPLSEQACIWEVGDDFEFYCTSLTLTLKNTSCVQCVFNAQIAVLCSGTRFFLVVVNDQITHISRECRTWHFNLEFSPPPPHSTQRIDLRKETDNKSGELSRVSLARRPRHSSSFENKINLPLSRAHTRL